MEKILNQILSELKELNQNQASIQSDIKDLKKGQNRIQQKLDSVHDQTPNFTEFRTETKEVKFIKHKLHETEEDVFDIKDHFKIVK